MIIKASSQKEIVLLVVLLLGLAGAARVQDSLAAPAAAFQVDSVDDVVDANPGNGVCSTAAGHCTLRAAVQEANASASSDRIILPAGTYVLAIPGGGEDQAATGDLDIIQSVEIAGAGA